MEEGYPFASPPVLKNKKLLKVFNKNEYEKEKILHKRIHF